jgi:parallel beta-helix repeat protein
VGHGGPPGPIAWPVTLMAKAQADGGRIAAVTFFLDGVPLGSDTTAPYVLDANPGILPPGSHGLRVEAVDNRGRRASTPAIRVRTGPSRTPVLRASPSSGLGKALRALRRGGVTVRLAPGRYRLSEVRLGSGSRLLGSGSRTVISPPRRKGYFGLLVAKGHNIRIAGLTLDGGGAGPGDGIAIAVFDGSSDVRIQRVRIQRVRRHGVNAWGAHANVSVQDSAILGAGTADAGVFALGSDESRDTSVIRTRVRGFRDFGILFAQREHRRKAAALHALALENDIADIRDPERDACVTSPRTATGCGTNEGGIWSGGVEAAIIGNRVRRARWDGIETVGSSTRTTIVRNEIRNTRTGIYLEHSTNHSMIARNLIVGAGTGINVEWWHEGAGSKNNRFAGNRIVASRGSGLFVDVGADGNRIVDNEFIRGGRPAIILQGSSNNVVRGNRACGANGAFVGQEIARWDDGRHAFPRANLLVNNDNAPSCRGADAR